MARNTLRTIILVSGLLGVAYIVIRYYYTVATPTEEVSRRVQDKERYFESYKTTGNNLFDLDTDRKDKELRDADGNHVSLKTRRENKSNFLVDGPACRIPDLDPFDPTIEQFIEKYEKKDCSRISTLTYQQGDSIFVNTSVAGTLNFSHCESDAIIRERFSDYKLVYIDNNARFVKQYDLKHEFTRVRCYNRSGGWFYENFYTIFVHKSEPETRYNDQFPNHKMKYGIKQAYNILIVGIDSVSRLNFMRHIVKTREYLMSKLGAIEMTGYNRIADNTFPNLVPFLSGKYAEELPWTEERDVNKSFDNYDFIFKRYASAGYRTLWAEDDPYIALFNYLKVGFTYPPTDYYNRPFSLAMESEAAIWSLDSYCIHNRAENDITLEYVFRYAIENKRRQRPFFGFSFLTRTTHFIMNKAQYVDDNHLKFITKLDQHGILDDTCLIYFSDHGMRFDDIRDTFIGKISARLPALYIYIPPSFRKQYPVVYKNVKTNAHRLSTPFDVYETLYDLLYSRFDVGQKTPTSSLKRGISLFNEIPLNRSCNDAGIIPHWCACVDRQPIRKDDKNVIKSCEVLVKHLNELTAKYRAVCYSLNLERVLSASKFMPDEGVDSIKIQQKTTDTASYYQITIETVPGKGRFEATLSSTKGVLEISGDVSRTNKYGNTSWCVDVTSLCLYSDQLYLYLI